MPSELCPSGNDHGRDLQSWVRRLTTSVSRSSSNGDHALVQENPDAAVPSLARLLFRIFDALCCGAILVDGRKTPIHLNERARKLVPDCLSTKCKQLRATDRRSDALLQTMLDHSLKDAATQVSPGFYALPLRRADRRPVICRAIPIDGDAQPGLDGAALVLLLIDPEDCPEPSSVLLKEVFGLTTAEARIARELLSGRTMQDAAEQNHVSVGTIRCQTKAIFAKTQTKRQADLVGLLTRVAVISR